MPGIQHDAPRAESAREGNAEEDETGTKSQMAAAAAAAALAPLFGQRRSITVCNVWRAAAPGEEGGGRNTVLLGGEVKSSVSLSLSPQVKPRTRPQPL